jgi:hypothetical protein
MEQRPVAHRPAEIGGKPGIAAIDRVDRVDLARIVEADLVIDDEIVPLAGSGHVVVAVGPDLSQRD